MLQQHSSRLPRVYSRGHSDIHVMRREPWLFDPATRDHMRNSVLQRYRLTPYVYTLIRHSHLTLDPIMRPVVYEFPDQPVYYTEEIAFMLGDSLYV